MSPKQFITDKEEQIAFQIKDAIEAYIPMLNKWVDSGMPFNEHLQKALEQREWIDNFITNFELQR